MFDKLPVVGWRGLHSRGPKAVLSKLRECTPPDTTRRLFNQGTLSNLMTDLLDDALELTLNDIVGNEE